VCRMLRVGRMPLLSPQAPSCCSEVFLALVRGMFRGVLACFAALFLMPPGLPPERQVTPRSWLERQEAPSRVLLISAPGIRLERQVVPSPVLLMSAPWSPS
jgi:hypothetical protein